MKNIIFEPKKRNTALPILYACSVISKINPQAVITSLPSDHYISTDKQFKDCLLKAYKAAIHLDQIIALGKNADYPNPSYGYIKVNKSSKHIYKVNQFIEKPDPKLAEKLLGLDCYWNLAIYTFPLTLIFSEFKKYYPNYFHIFNILSSNYSTADIKKIYNQSNLSFSQKILKMKKFLR